MATPAKEKARRPFNIRLSLQKFLADVVETPNTTPLGKAYTSGWVDYDDDDFDNPDYVQWARFEIIEPGGGTWGRVMFQITCFSRRSDDRFGLEIDKMAQLFLAAFRTEAGRLVQLYDFTVDQSSPDEIEHRRLRVVNTDGKEGEPEEIGRVDPPEGTAGVALTYLAGVVPDDYVGERYRSAD